MSIGSKGLTGGSGADQLVPTLDGVWRWFQMFLIFRSVGGFVDLIFPQGNRPSSTPGYRDDDDDGEACGLPLLTCT